MGITSGRSTTSGAVSARPGRSNASHISLIGTVDAKEYYFHTPRQSAFREAAPTAQTQVFREPHPSLRVERIDLYRLDEVSPRRPGRLYSELASHRIQRQCTKPAHATGVLIGRWDNRRSLVQPWLFGLTGPSRPGGPHGQLQALVLFRAVAPRYRLRCKSGSIQLLRQSLMMAALMESEPQIHVLGKIELLSISSHSFIVRPTKHRGSVIRTPDSPLFRRSYAQRSIGLIWVVVYTPGPLAMRSFATYPRRHH